MENNIKWIQNSKDSSLGENIFNGIIILISSIIFVLDAIFILHKSFEDIWVPKKCMGFLLAWIIALIVVNEIIIPVIPRVKNSRLLKSQISLIVVIIGGGILFAVYHRYKVVINDDIAYLLSQYLKKYNDYYKTSLVVRVSHNANGIIGFSYILAVIYYCLYSISFGIRKKLPMVFITVIPAGLVLAIGDNVSWKYMVAFIFAIIILYSKRNENNLIGNVNDKNVVSNKIIMLLIRCALTAAGVAVVSFGCDKTAKNFLEKSDKAIEFQQQFERSVKNSNGYSFSSKKIQLDNNKPSYNNRIELTVTSDNKPLSNLYLKNFVGVDYEEGIWENATNDFLQESNEENENSDEVMDKVNDNLYYQVKMLRSKESESIDYITDFDIKYNSYGTAAAVPYGVLKNDDISYKDDMTFEKDRFSKELKLEGITSNDIDLWDDKYNADDCNEDFKVIDDFYGRYVKKYAADNCSLKGIDKVAQKIVRKYCGENVKNAYDFMVYDNDYYGKYQEKYILSDRYENYIYDYGNNHAITFEEYCDNWDDMFAYISDEEKRARNKQNEIFKMASQDTEKYYEFNNMEDSSDISRYECSKNTYNVLRYVMREGKNGISNREGLKLDLAKYVSEYLRRNYDYSLELDSIDNGKDPIDYFLLESKEGYCMHFATAGTLILREMGIPARYASGYIVKENSFTDAKGKYKADVPDMNAHAWTEIYIEGEGWIPVEMTPGYSTGFDYVPTEDNGKEVKKEGALPGEELETENTENEDELPLEEVDEEIVTEEESESLSETPSENLEDEAESEMLPSESSKSDSSDKLNQSLINRILESVYFKVAAALIDIILCICIFAAVRKNTEKRRLNDFIKRERYNKVILCLNKKLQRKLIMKAKIVKKNLKDKEYLEYLIANYDKINSKDWEKYMDILRKARYSDSRITKDEFDYCAKLYKNILM